MEVSIFKDHVLWRIGSVPITETMLVSAATSAGLILVARQLAHAAVRGSASTAATIAETAITSLDDLVESIIGRKELWVISFSGTLFLFIAASTLVGQLPGVPSALADLGTTSALATLVFLAVPLAGVRSLGVWGYVRHYFRPNPLFAPLHMISELSRTLALSVRLFGNMLSGSLIVGVLVSLTGLLVPMPMMALDVLIGLLQAYIFAILATVYIGAAIRAGEET